jgi:anti-anti-sigma factor
MSSEQAGRESRPDDREHVSPARSADQVSAPPLLLDQIFDSRSLYQLRASVAAHGGNAGLSQPRTDDLVVAVHELAANVVRHGSGRGRLIMWQRRDEVRCRITDEGADEEAGGRVRHVAPRMRGASAKADGAPWRIQPGHGLWLVRQLADRVGVQPGPNGVATTITFSLKAPGPQPGFRLARSTSPAGPVIALSGQLDLNSAAELTEAISELVASTGGARLILDLAGLTFWDSFGLAALLRAQSRVSAGAVARLVLRDVPAPLLHELRATGLSKRFTFADGTEQAISD